MKRIIIFSIIFAFLGLQSLPAQNTKEQKKVLLIRSSYNWQDSLWEFNSLRNFQYNNKNQVVLEQIYEFNDNQFELSYETFIEYYEFDSIKRISSENYLCKYYYNEFHQLSETYQKYYFPVNQTTISRYNYDEEGKLSKLFVLSDIDTLFEDDYLYDVDRNLKDIYEYSKWLGVWAVRSNEHFEYDENNYILEDHFYHWKEDQWEEISRYIYQYFNNYSEIEYIYDLLQTANGTTSIKMHGWYDSTGLIKEQIFQNWHDSIWDNSKRELYYYGVIGINGEDENNAGPTKIKLYPNPNQGKFHIEFNDDIKEHSVLLLNLNGSPVYQKTAIQTNKLDIDISDAPKGIYMIRIKSGHMVYTQKVILNN